MRKTGLRPQEVASRLEIKATGTITSWAATMQADIKTGAALFRPSPDFWPTSGNIAALARWNRTTEAAKIAMRRSLNSSATPIAACALSRVAALVCTHDFSGGSHRQCAGDKSGAWTRLSIGHWRTLSFSIPDFSHDTLLGICA